MVIMDLVKKNRQLIKNPSKFREQMVSKQQLFIK